MRAVLLYLESDPLRTPWRSDEGLGGHTRDLAYMLLYTNPPPYDLSII